ncbi:MAG: hypothetical protein AAF433_16260 [Bacteroidota bacterium]
MHSGQIGGSSPQNGGSPLRGLLGLVVFGLVIYLAFTVFAWLYKMLWYAVPVALGAVAILDHKLLLSIFRRIGNVVGRNPIAGLIVGAIFCLSLPFVAPILVIVALVRRNLKRKMSEQSDQMNSMFEMFQQQASGKGREPREIEIDYEELPADPPEGKDFV